jgi:HlyD family secretion protein
MKRTFIIGGIIVAVAIVGLIVISKMSSKKEISILYAEVKKGEFEILVTTTGELQAETSIDIRGPELTQSRGIRVSDIKIQDLVAEGTEVKQGDYIATLDRTTFDNSLKDQLERLTTSETNYQMRMLDTAVTLTNLRDNIKNQGYAVEEATITLQNSQFEPPSTVRQAQITLERAKRTLEMMHRNYSLRKVQVRADILNIRNDLEDQRQRARDLENVLSKFIITAPASGMVIYKRERNGTKRKVGSSISSFDLVVATLPDMSSMVSKTYVNEIDVSKVKFGQKVNITVDAFPEKAYTGVVTNVANIGEQLPNADAKVFEVIIKLDNSDPILKPSMTTGNKIITKTIEDVIYIPLESVQTSVDSIPFVYTKNGYKQIVLLGESNENNIIIEKGLEPGATIFLSVPENPDKFRLVGEDLTNVVKERARIKKAEEDSIRKAAESLKNERSFSRGNMGGRRGGMRDSTGGRRRMNNQRDQQGISPEN